MNTKTPKILLVNPPSEFRTPILPLGLASIAAYLKDKDENLNLSVIDCWAENLGFEELENRITQSKADIIGVYIVSPRYDKAKLAIEVCKKASPKSIIIAGGPHPSSMPAETLREIPQLDICVIGEGEITMYEIVKGCQLSEIKGIAFRNGNEIKLTPPRDFIKNLDELPFPARELFPLKKYKSAPPWGRKNPYFNMITSRGCPFQCAYCSKDVFKEQFRARSPQKVCDEIEELMAKYGAKEIQFYDDDFTLDMKRAEAICDEILRRNIKISWACLTRVDQVNEPLLEKMKKAGCWLICYGVESGDEQILYGINKIIKTDQIISTFGLTKKIGLMAMCALIVGLPGETKETIRNTLNLIKKIKPDFISCGVLSVFPGSRLYKLIRAKRYPGQLRTLRNGENMPGIYFKGNYTILENNLTLKELKEGVKKIEQEFYLRPQYLWQCLKSIRSFHDLKYYFNAGLVVIKSFFK